MTKHSQDSRLLRFLLGEQCFGAVPRSLGIHLRGQALFARESFCVDRIEGSPNAGDDIAHSAAGQLLRQTEPLTGGQHGGQRDARMNSCGNRNELPRALFNRNISCARRNFAGMDQAEAGMNRTR